MSLSKRKKALSPEQTLPLTAGQELLYLAHRFSRNKACVNISALLHVDCEIDPNLLLQAVCLSMMRYESANLRLHRFGKQVRQYISSETPDPIDILDYTGRTQEEMQSELEKLAGTPFPHNMLDTQLYSARLVRKPDGFWGVFLCSSHFAFDVYALMDAGTKILHTYKALADALPIPAARGDYRKMSEEDLVIRTAGRDKLAEQTAYWENEVFRTEPLYVPAEPEMSRCTKGKRHGKPTNLFNSAGHYVHHRIDAPLVRLVSETAVKWKRSEQCLYLLAAYSYLSMRNDNARDITLSVTVPRRAKLLYKLSGGTRATGVFFRFCMPGSMTVSEALGEIASLQKKNFQNAEVMMSDITGIWKKKFGCPPLDSYNSIHFSYSPHGVDVPEGLRAHLSVFSNGCSSMPVYLAIFKLDDSGDMCCIYDCMHSRTKPDTADRMHKHLLRALRAICENPDMTLDELNRV